MRAGPVIWGILFLYLLVWILKFVSLFLICYGVGILAKTYLNPVGVRAVVYIMVGVGLWGLWLKDLKVKRKDKPEDDK